MSGIGEHFEAMMGKHREFHSGFQIDHFVIAAAGHPWAQYQQALRELATRFDALKVEQIEIERAELDRDEAREKMSLDPDD